MSNYFNSMDRGYYEGDNPGLYADEIGFTTIPTQDQLEELKSKIKLGASKVELGFMGTGKSNPQQPSPEAYGERDREAMKELAKVNEIELTTHASMTQNPLSGLNGQEKRFSDSTRNEAKDEIKRAIDFAADVSEGGPVVAHVGEFPRSVSEAKEEGGEKGKFQEHKTYKFNDDGTIEKDKNGNPKYSYGGEESTLYLANEDTGELIDQVKKDQPIYFNEVKKDKNGNKMFDENGKPIYTDVKDDYGAPKVERWYWEDIEKAAKAAGRNPENWYFDTKIEEQKAQLLGRIAQEKRMKEASDSDGLEDEYNKSIQSSQQQLKELEDKRKKAKPVEEVAADNSAKSLGELGVYAYKKEQKKNLQKPLYVSPENIFPEQYGGHPDELKKMITKGREYMTEMLKEKENMKRDEAKKVADQHIKATFDIGHAYTWRRYFNGTDKEFNEWFAKKVKNLQDKGYIGHVHISDNFGYYDEHVSPGHGDAPVKETVNKLKEKGVDFVVEAGKGGDKDWQRSLEELGKPIYGLSRPYEMDSWQDIRTSYAGKTPPPYFLAQPHAEQLLGGERIKQDFSSWAEIPFE